MRYGNGELWDQSDPTLEGLISHPQCRCPEWVVGIGLQFATGEPVGAEEGLSDRLDAAIPCLDVGLMEALVAALYMAFSGFPVLEVLINRPRPYR